MEQSCGQFKLWFENVIRTYRLWLIQIGSGVKSNEVNTGRFRIKEEDNIYPLYKQIYSHNISLFLFIFVSIIHGHDSSCPRFGRDNAELIQKVAKNVMNAELPVRD